MPLLPPATLLPASCEPDAPSRRRCRRGRRRPAPCARRHRGAESAPSGRRGRGRRASPCPAEPSPGRPGGGFRRPRRRPPAAPPRRARMQSRRGQGTASATRSWRASLRGLAPDQPADGHALRFLEKEIAESRETFSEKLGGFDLEDLVLQLRAAWRRDLDGLALLLAEDRLADRRLVRELLLRRVGLPRADDVVLDRFLGGDVPKADVRADADDVFRDLLLVDHARRQEPLLELGDPVLEHRLLVLRVVVLGVLGDVAELTSDADAIGDLAPSLGREVRDLFLQLFVTLRSEDHFLHDRASSMPKEKRAGRHIGPRGGGMVPAAPDNVKLTWLRFSALCR